MELNSLPSSSQAATALSVEVDAHSTQVRVGLAGELAIDTAEEFSGAVTRLAREGHYDLVVDLGGLTFCDAKGLRALLQAHLDLQSSGGHVGYANPTPQLDRLLSISGVGDALDLVRDPAQPDRRRWHTPGR